jgi:ABC-type transport system involved in cytochrome c biogenesis permease subunit
MDTLARSVLMDLRGTQTYKNKKGKKDSAIQFLYILCNDKENASDLKVFKIDNPILKSQIAQQDADNKYYSLREIEASKISIGKKLKFELQTNNTYNSYLNALGNLAQKIDLFNRVQLLLHKADSLEKETHNRKLKWEVKLNTYAPFFRVIWLYLLSFLMVLLFWIKPKSFYFLSTAFLITTTGFALHGASLLTRMYIQGAPPVTNLYSSAVFIGWASVLFGLLIELKQRTGIGIAVSAIIGTGGLLIAHNLMDFQNSLGIIQASLNSNFWLTAHVITISLGYSAAFVSGVSACIQLLSGSQSEKTIYGITCFALLFTLSGTLLGGIWADHAWGRFWGWDPKENGALIMILWFSLMLQCKSTRLVHTKGFLYLAVIGNIITSWCWFGTNLLGVGLHAYGFTQKGLLSLLLFWFSQIVVLIYGRTKAKRYPPERTGL